MLRVIEDGHLLEALYYSIRRRKKGSNRRRGRRNGQRSVEVSWRKKKRVGCFRIGFAGRSCDGG